MKKFSKILEESGNNKLFRVFATVELLIPSDSEGEASYISDSILASINNISEFKISKVEENSNKIK